MTRFIKGCVLSVALFVPLSVYAQVNFSFPVKELGGCANQNECRVYCDVPENIPACADFAKQKRLADTSAVQAAHQLSEALLSQNAPGNCKTIKECISYCDDVSHLDECLAFTETFGISTESTKHIKRVSAYLKTGGELPGDCSSQRACLAYCLTPDHVSECVSFAMNAGIIPGKGDEKEDGEVVYIENIATTTHNIVAVASSTIITEETGEVNASTTPPSSVSGGGGGTASALPEDALVAPEVFRFASFPEDTALCLRERLGEEAESMIESGDISTDELRTAVESCILEALSLDESLRAEELLFSTQAANVSPLRSFTQEMLATPFRVADYILRLLMLKH